MAGRRGHGGRSERAARAARAGDGAGAARRRRRAARYAVEQGAAEVVVTDLRSKRCCSRVSTACRPAHPLSCSAATIPTISSGPMWSCAIPMCGATRPTWPRTRGRQARRDGDRLVFPRLPRQDRRRHRHARQEHDDAAAAPHPRPGGHGAAARRQPRRHRDACVAAADHARPLGRAGTGQLDAGGLAYRAPQPAPGRLHQPAARPPQRLRLDGRLRRGQDQHLPLPGRGRHRALQRRQRLQPSLRRRGARRARLALQSLAQRASSLRSAPTQHAPFAYCGRHPPARRAQPGERAGGDASRRVDRRGASDHPRGGGDASAARRTGWRSCACWTASPTSTTAPARRRWRASARCTASASRLC